MKKSVSVDTATQPRSKSGSQPRSQSKGMLYYLMNFWIFIPAFMYFKVVAKYAVNIPYQDDYDGVLDFLCQYKQAGFGDKLALLFSQHGEHRIFFLRFASVMSYYLQGKVNFLTLIYLTNFIHLASFVIIIYFLTKLLPKYWNFAALGFGLCFFDLSNYENADFALSGIVNYGAILFLLLSILFYSFEKKKNIGIAAFFQVLGIYSSGAGPLACVAIIVYNFLQKDKLRIIVSTAIAVVFVPLYFVHYAKIAPMGEMYTGHSLDRIVPFFFHMLGGHFSYEQGIVAGILLLIALAVLIPINLKLNYPKAILPFLALLVYIFGSVATASIFRSNSGVLQSYSSRYMIYSHLLVALAYLFLIIKIGERKVKWVALIGGCVLLVYGYADNYYYGESGFAREQYRLQYSQYYYGDHKQAATEKAKAVADEACRLEIYCIQDAR